MNVCFVAHKTLKKQILKCLLQKNCTKMAQIGNYTYSFNLLINFNSLTKDKISKLSHNTMCVNPNGCLFSIALRLLGA